MKTYQEIQRSLFSKDMQTMRYGTYLKAFVGKREVLVWGGTYKSDWFIDLCRLYDEIKITGYIDNNPELVSYKNLPVYRPEILKQKNCFVFVALENRYSQVLSQLEECGLVEFRDYLYPSGNSVTVVSNERQYFDWNGNEIHGVVNGYQVKLSRGSRLIIGKNCRIDKTTTFQLEKNAMLVIGENCVIYPNSHMCMENAICHIGNNCSIGSNLTLYQNNSIVTIGEGFSCGEDLYLGATQEAVCNIGEDCMFSREVSIQCTDGHNYFDLEKRQNIGKQKNYVINVDNHVWVGGRSSLLCGTDIGAGSIVGWGSLVNKKFPANVTLAGSPAKIIRKNVAWIRESGQFITDSDYYEPYRYLQ